MQSGDWEKCEIRQTTEVEVQWKFYLSKHENKDKSKLQQFIYAFITHF